MIVCLCHGVPSGRIHALIGAGADTPRKIAAACGAGTDCGACVGEIRAILAEAGQCTRREAPRRGAASPYVTSPCVVAGEGP
jgi:bacterioferritin-associated ferredoxin